MKDHEELKIPTTEFGLSDDCKVLWDSPKKAFNFTDAVSATVHHWSRSK